MNVLEVNDLSVRLGDKVLVDHASFSVSEGECLGILGESGSGKSMSMKAIMGLLDKQFEVSGSAIFNGRDLLSESRENMRKLRGKDICMVLQNPMTCFDPLYRIGNQMAKTFSCHLDMTKAEIYQTSIEILEKMHIDNPEEVLEKYPHQLSGGMLQRIMIGLALAFKPKLLIADEPTTAIDAITQHDILEAFMDIRKKHNTSMVFITHDLGAISKVADRIIVMNDGRIVDRGDLDFIIHHADDEYTRLLIEKRNAVMTKYESVLRSSL